MFAGRQKVEAGSSYSVPTGFEDKTGEMPLAREAKMSAVLSHAP
jgi:hypothetical protein